MRISIRSGSMVLVAVALTGGARADDDQTALARQAQTILKKNCHRCHGQEGANEGGFNYVLDRQRLVAARKIVQGNWAQSRLRKKLKKEEIHTRDSQLRPK